MSDPNASTKTITVAGESVQLPTAVYNDLQGLIDECLDRHAIALLREHTHCEYEAARAALVSDGNFDHEARKAYRAKQDAQPSKARKPKATKAPKQAGAKKPSAGAVVGGLFAGTTSGKGKVVKLLAAAVLLLLAGVLYAFQTGRATSHEKPVFYYDLNTGKLFTAPYSQVIPVRAPSEGEGLASGVRAFVYSCGSCRDANERFAGYLVKNTDELNSAIRAAGPDGVDPATLPAATRVRLIRTTEEDSKWVREDAAEAAAVYAYPGKACTVTKAQRCRAELDAQ